MSSYMYRIFNNVCPVYTVQYRHQKAQVKLLHPFFVIYRLYLANGFTGAYENTKRYVTVRQSIVIITLVQFLLSVIGSQCN